jgi:hypothetical protein
VECLNFEYAFQPFVFYDKKKRNTLKKSTLEN